MSLSSFIPFNSKIFLITKLNFRYEGTLHSIDRKDNTLTLTNVRSFGTAESPALIPPVYEYILFPAADIHFIEVREPVVYLNQVNQYTGYNSYLLLPFFQWNQANTPTSPGTAVPTTDPKALTTMNLSLKDSDLDWRALTGLSDINQSGLDTISIQELTGNLSMASNSIPRPDGSQILSKSVPVIRKHQENQPDHNYKPNINSSSAQENTPEITTPGPAPAPVLPDQIVQSKQHEDSSGKSLDNSRGGHRYPRGRPNPIYRPKISEPSLDTEPTNGDSLHEKPPEDRISTITLTPSSSSDTYHDKASNSKKHQRK
jgi:hypothetical protein